VTTSSSLTSLRAQWEARSVVAQLPSGKQAFTYVNRTGGCLDIKGNQVVVNPCSGSLSQQWIRDFNIGGNGAFRPITNRLSGRHVNTSSASAGASVTTSNVAQNFQVLGIASTP
jgi:hypothetical protein